MADTPDGDKRLLIGNSNRLRTHLQNVPPDLTQVEEVPALAALAYASHTILATTPWLEYTEPQRFEPTIKSDGYVSTENLYPWDLDEAILEDDEEIQTWFGYGN